MWEGIRDDAGTEGTSDEGEWRRTRANDGVKTGADAPVHILRNGVQEQRKRQTACGKGNGEGQLQKGRGTRQGERREGSTRLQDVRVESRGKNNGGILQTLDGDTPG